MLRSVLLRRRQLGLQLLQLAASSRALLGRCACKPRAPALNRRAHFRVPVLPPPREARRQLGAQQPLPRRLQQVVPPPLLRPLLVPAAPAARQPHLLDAPRRHALQVPHALLALLLQLARHLLLQLLLALPRLALHSPQLPPQALRLRLRRSTLRCHLLQLLAHRAALLRELPLLQLRRRRTHHLGPVEPPP